jgi:L-malate glycosyltransferase
MKSIIIISQEYPPAIGGAGVVAEQNFKGLCSAGFKVIVIKPLIVNFKKKNYFNKTLKTVIWIVSLFLQTCNFYKLNKCDNIILNDIGSIFIFSLIPWNGKFYKKTIVYMHGGGVNIILGEKKKSIKVFLFSGILKKILNNCKNIIAVSYELKRQILEISTLYNNKLSVIHPGVNPLHFNLDRGTSRPSFLASDSIMILTVARISPEKNYERMLRLFIDLFQKDERFHWVVIGNGNFNKLLDMANITPKVKGNIHFLGGLDRKKVSEYYGFADLFWLLSKREAFGLVFIEAQLSGCPVLGSSLPGIKEAISRGNGCTFESDLEIIDYVLNCSYMSIDRSMVRKRALKYSLPLQITSLANVL